MTFWLQPPGDTPVAMPDPQVSGVLDLGATEHRALSGARTVDYVGSPRRTYTFARARMSADQWSLLEELALGGAGEVGPVILHDPWRRNILTPNQATCGDVLRTTEGVVVTAGITGLGLLGPFPGNTAVQGNYIVSAQWPAAGGANTVRFDWQTPVTGPFGLVGSLTPIVAGLTYTFQVNTANSGGTSQSVQAGIYWADNAGGLIAGSVGAASVTTGTLTQRSVTAAAPGNAAYCWGWLGNAATLTAVAPYMIVDAAMLSQAAAPQPWTMGTGVPRVAFTDLGETYHPGSTRDGTFTLVEVG